MKKRKILRKILNNPQNVRFGEVVAVVETFGFKFSRVSGSHHIFTRPDIKEIVDLQNVGGQVKSYQVRQFLKLVERYDLEFKEEV